MNVIRTLHFGFSLNWSFCMVCLSPQNTAYDSPVLAAPFSSCSLQLWTWTALFWPWRCAVFFCLISSMTWPVHTPVRQGSVKCFFLFAFVSCLYLSTLVELSTTRISCENLPLQRWRPNGGTYSNNSALFALSGLTSPLFFLKYKGLLTWSLCIRGTAMGRTFKTAILRHRLDFCVLPGTQIMCFIWKH